MTGATATSYRSSYHLRSGWLRMVRGLLRCNSSRCSGAPCPRPHLGEVADTMIEASGPILPTRFAGLILWGWSPFSWSKYVCALTKEFPLLLAGHYDDLLQYFWQGRAFVTDRLTIV